MSGSTADVIDLTGDASSPTEPQGRPHAPPNYEATATRNRPQRFDRSIINLDDQDDGPVGERQGSPEIQFLTSRPRSRSLSASRRLDRRRSGLVPTARSPIPRPQFPVRVSAVERIPRQMPADWAALRQFQRQIRGNFGGGGGNDELVAFESHAGGNFPVPGALDFLHAGFNYEQPSRPQHTPRLPTYDAPPAAEHGFTRSPKEDDLLVCARCENELGLGDEDRSQVWVVKACGHVWIIHHSYVYINTNIYLRSTADCVRSTGQSGNAHKSYQKDSILGEIVW